VPWLRCTAGEDGVAAPRLRDAALPLPRLRQAYTEMVVTMRTMFQACRLVHADLSEYNILYHKASVWVTTGGRVMDWLCIWRHPGEMHKTGGTRLHSEAAGCCFRV
jgi:hypothetical protein